MSLLPVDSQDDDRDQDDGQANQDGDQEVHVQVERDDGLNEFGVTPCKKRHCVMLIDVIFRAKAILTIF